MCNHQELTQGGRGGPHLQDRWWPESVCKRPGDLRSHIGSHKLVRNPFFPQITEVSWGACHKGTRTPHTHVRAHTHTLFHQTRLLIIRTFNFACTEGNTDDWSSGGCSKVWYRRYRSRQLGAFHVPETPLDPQLVQKYRDQFNTALLRSGEAAYICIENRALRVPHQPNSRVSVPALVLWVSINEAVTYTWIPILAFPIPDI